MSAEFTYPIATLDHILAIATGQVPGATSSGKASVREGIAIGATEDVWCGLTAVIPDLSSPERIVIVSDDAGDTAGDAAGDAAGDIPDIGRPGATGGSNGVGELDS